MWRPLSAYPLYCAYCLIVPGAPGRRTGRPRSTSTSAWWGWILSGWSSWGRALEVVILLGRMPTGIVADVCQPPALASSWASPSRARASRSTGRWGRSGPRWWRKSSSGGLGATFTSGALGAWIADELGGRDSSASTCAGRSVQARRSAAGHRGGGRALLRRSRADHMILAGAALLAFAGFLVAVMPERGFVPVARGTRGPWLHFGATLRAGAVWYEERLAPGLRRPGGALGDGQRELRPAVGGASARHRPAHDGRDDTGGLVRAESTRAGCS